MCDHRNKLIAIASLATALAGCGAESIAAKEARVREATATAVRDANSDQIVISELQRGAARWTWKAEAGGKTYLCDADDMLRLPDCQPIG